MAESTGANIDLTLGVIFVGLVVTAGLFGVTTAQSGWYFRHYPQDRCLLKFLVVAVWTLDAAHLGLYFATINTYLIQKAGLYFSQQPLPWASNVQLLCNACAIGITQSFYASRIWTLSRRKLLLAVMIVFIAATWLFSVVLFVKTIMTKTVAEYIHLTSYDIAMSSMGASTDILLCGALVFLLVRSRTGTEGADRLINKLLLYTVNTGLLTSVFAVMSVITVVIMPTTSLFVIFYYIGTRLYSVSLLAMLNARINLRIEAERMGERTLPKIEVTTRGATHRQSLQAPALHGSPKIVVSKQREESAMTVPGEEPAAAVPPSHIYCDSEGRCYVMPDGEFSWGQCFPDDPVLPLSHSTLSESRNALYS